MPRLDPVEVLARAHRERRRRHRNAVTQIHAASLRHVRYLARQSALQKQETPSGGADEVSTAHTAGTEVRAASAQSDRTG